MGIESRGYMTGESRGSRGWGQTRDGWSMVTILIVANVVIFLLQTFTWRTELLERWFALDLKHLLQGQVWRLTTYDFLHETREGLPLHLLFNMWLLYLTGRRIESKYGSNEFLALYLLAGILSGVVYLLWGLLTRTDIPAIGASGAAVALLIIYAMNWPHERWSIWGIIPVPVALLAAFGAFTDIWPMIQDLAGRRGKDDGIAHAAHVGGMLFGLLYVKQGWNITGMFASQKGFSLKKSLQRRPRLRVHAPENDFDEAASAIPPDVESRLDSLLEKISAQGEKSLTEEERRFLAETSRRYRNRK